MNETRQHKLTDQLRIGTAVEHTTHENTKGHGVMFKEGEVAVNIELRDEMES
jgi:hypothetical protein